MQRYWSVFSLPSPNLVLTSVKGEKIMTLMKSLKFTNEAPATNKIDPVQRRRLKFLAAIDKQRMILEAELKDETYTVEKQKKKVADDGTITPVTVVQRPRKWWWSKGDSTYSMTPRFGLRPINFKDDMCSIDVGVKSNIIKTLDILADATKAGELDSSFSVSKK